MKEQEIKISFITPNYNDSKTITRQVESIMDQDLKGVEQIIVDDGSTDDSRKVLDKLQKKYKNKLKVIYLEKNQGACVARNIGAKEARGRYLSFLPADAKLYPGVARIWVETLDEHPESDFLYGGYKFTDDNYNEVYSYLGDYFDPYFLKITNYIDGSFPLKKELFDKMGGWDPAIKSLQDWDLWLNAVLKYNAKGIYKREVFFETTLPHPGGLSADSHANWTERVRQIKEKYGIEQKKICVTGQGAEYHAKNVAKILGADYMYDPSFKPHNYEMIYVVGFFGNVAKAFTNTRAMRVVHWIGSDILAVKNAPDKEKNWVLNWLDHNVDINLCEFEQTRKELEEIGIKARVVPFPPEKFYEVQPLPEKFSVAVYQPYQNKDFYQPELVNAVAKAMPDVDFYFFGDPTMFGTKDNITHCGTVKMFDKDDLVKKTSAIIRFTPHDGLPLSVVEWLSAGRNALLTIDLPYTNKVTIDFSKTENEKKNKRIMKTNVDLVVKEIKNLKELKENKKGSEYFKKLCDPKKFSDILQGFLECDIKKWWDEVSDVWEFVESGQESTGDIGTIIKEVKKLQPKTLLDLGCGTGRFADLLPVENYTGIDFSQKLINDAKEKHPNNKFECVDIKDYHPLEKFDLVFSFASLLHIKPKDFKEYVNNIKTLGKKAIFVEPKKDQSYQNSGGRMLNEKLIEKQKKSDWIFNVKYTWIHDYLSSFNVEKIIPMSNNRNLYIINLE
jgi:glycosyltransferase involved in cell wall biosynthesis